MEVRREYRYEADINKVRLTFGDPEYVRAKYDAQGARNVKILRCEQTDEILDLDVQREVPAEVPGMLKKFLGEWNQVTQIERWRGSIAAGYECDMSIEIKGVPVKMKGTMTLRPDGDGAKVTVLINIDSKVPLVGAKLAEFVSFTVKQTVKQEFSFLEHYLGEIA